MGPVGGCVGYNRGVKMYHDFINILAGILLIGPGSRMVFIVVIRFVPEMKCYGVAKAWLNNRWRFVFGLAMLYAGVELFNLL